MPNDHRPRRVVTQPWSPTLPQTYVDQRGVGRHLCRDNSWAHVVGTCCRYMLLSGSAGGATEPEDGLCPIYYSHCHDFDAVYVVYILVHLGEDIP